MNYVEALNEVITAAEPASGLSRAELQERIAGITETLKGSLGNVDRILLCGDRASLKKALEALPVDAA